MKAVQVPSDERLLSELDSTVEVRTEGRSAVLRRVTEDALRKRRQEQIAEQYRRAYADGGGLGKEWGGWEEQGEWSAE